MIPKTLLIKQDGSSILLLDSDADEHGVGIDINSLKTGVQDIFLFSLKKPIAPPLNKDEQLKIKLTPIVRRYLQELVREKYDGLGFYLLKDDPSFIRYLKDIPKGNINYITTHSDGSYTVDWDTPSLLDYRGWWHLIELDKELKFERAYLQT